MRKNRQRLPGLGISILGLLTLTPILLGQVSPDSEAASPLTTDWSQHHLIFSRPATAQQAERVKQDPRYGQQLRRQSVAKLPEGDASDAMVSDSQPASRASRREKNLKLAGDWSEDLGSGATIGATNYPAKYSFQITTANCASAAQPDFVVYGTGLAGSATQASIVAYDNLYSGCSGTVPMVYWAYNTGGGTVDTSPVFSQDGKQLAFVQAGGGFKASIVLLKWAPSSTDTVGSPTTLTRTTNGQYPTCIAPCMTSAILQDTSNVVHLDTYSSVFYDYSSDTAYVGDDGGWLHQFNPVFKGVPAEVRSAGWPVQVNPITPTALTSPVFDFTSGRVFVADNGGFLYRVGPNTAFVATSSGPLDVSSSLDSGPGIIQGPIVDSTAQVVYVFAASDGSGGCVGGSDCSAVYELPTNFPSGSIGGEAVVGASTFPPATPEPLYIGGFDSTYLNSANSTGNLYVCGNTGGPPVLYQIAIAAGTMNGLGTPLAVISNATTPCSPVTDLMNPNVSGGPAEFLFASVQTQGVSSACSNGGCVFHFKDTPWQPSTAYTVGQEVLDTHLQIQVVSVAGTSGSATPGWSAIIGHSTTDGSVHWLNQGAESAFTLAAWQPNHAYALHNKILDANKNVEFVTTAGTSGGTVPTFSMTAGGITSDGATLKWTNLGAIGTAALAAAGGTSGIIIDNTVGSGTLAGASQVYFSTLSNQACGTSGTGGCAVQASQSALQ